MVEGKRSHTDKRESRRDSQGEFMSTCGESGTFPEEVI